MSANCRCRIATKAFASPPKLNWFFYFLQQLHGKQKAVSHLRIIFLHLRGGLTGDLCENESLKQTGAMIDNYTLGNNCPDNFEYFSSWTINGSPIVARDLFRFDQFDIPSNATVSNGELSHFYAVNSFGVKNTSLTNSTMSVVHAITSTWNESSAT